MTCQEFLVRHSEYVDGVLDSCDVARLESHMSACPACSRYDRVVRGGLRLLVELPEVEPASDFYPRLQHRIYSMDERLKAYGRSPGVGAMVSLAVASALAVCAWSPLLRLSRIADGVEAAPERAVAEAVAEPASRRVRRSAAGPVQLAAEAESLPYITPVRSTWAARGTDRAAFGAAEAWWWTGGARPTGMSGAFRSVHTPVDFRIPGPYSPLIIEAPTFRRPAILTRTEGARLGRD